MHRPYTKKDILNKFGLLKKIDNLPSLREVPQRKRRGVGFSFGTDIIVGFPTETDQDFQETLDLCQQIGFSKIHTFPFLAQLDTKMCFQKLLYILILS